MQQLAFTSIQDVQEEPMVLLNVTNYLALLGTPPAHIFKKITNKITEEKAKIKIKYTKQYSICFPSVNNLITKHRHQINHFGSMEDRHSVHI